MIFIEDKDDELNTVLDELKNKLTIEVPFEKETKKLFDKIVSDYSKQMTSKELKKKFIDIEMLYGDATEALLDKYYQRAVKARIKDFKNDKVVKKRFSKEVIQVKSEQIKQEMQAYINKRKKQMSKEILKTTKSNYQQSVELVEKLIAENNLKLTIAEKNSLILDNFNQRLYNRATSISITETQNIIQKAKAVSALSVIEDLERRGEEVKKRWVATLDSATRDAHAQAHGQLVGRNELFTVDGEQLEYPGDTSNGASISNTINCRCDYFYTIVK
jgi:hypothetical protein